MCDEITIFNEQKNVCLFLGLHFLVDMKASDSIIDCNYVWHSFLLQWTGMTTITIVNYRNVTTHYHYRYFQNTDSGF
jgi:hypothetical protein